MRNYKSGELKERKRLVSMVSEWADTNGLSSAPNIDSLVRDLQEGSNWNYWASIPVDEILPSPATPRTNKLRSLYKRVLYLRNLLIFLPVTVTWIAISEASSSFSDYIAYNPGTLINFLQFWQNGYGYLEDVWRLSNIALIDFLILSSIMLLTVAIQILLERANKSEFKELRAISDGKDRLSATLFDFFSRNQQITMLNMSSTVSSSLRDLSRSTKNLESVSKDLRILTREIRKLDIATKELKKTVSEAKQLKGKIGKGR